MSENKNNWRAIAAEGNEEGKNKRIDSRQSKKQKNDKDDDFGASEELGS